LNYLLIHFLGILVLCHLKVTSRDLCKCPPSLVLLLSKLIEDFQRLLTFVKAKLQIGMPEYLKQGHHVSNVEELGLGLQKHGKVNIRSRWLWVLNHSCWCLLNGVP
jgi:hypothetical protein